MIVALIPSRNEAPLIARTVRAAREFVDVVVVVDESEDGGKTEWQAHSAGAVTIHGSWGGIGPSLLTGFRWALRHTDAEQIVTLDVQSHNPRAAARLADGNPGITIGSRFTVGANYIGRQWRANASRGFAYMMNLRSGNRIRDWTSGFRAYRREAVDKLCAQTYRASMHGWQAEVLLRAIDFGIPIREQPISYTAGDTSLRPAYVWEAVTVR